VDVERSRDFPHSFALCKKLAGQPGLIRIQFPWTTKANATLFCGFAAG